MERGGFIKDTDKGWKKMIRVLSELDGQAVDVGYITDSETAMIAGVQEFGANIKREAGEVTQYRKIKRNGDFAAGGRLVKKKRANFASTHKHKAYTISIPSRPFMSDYFDRSKDKIQRFSAGQMKRVVDRKISATEAMQAIGVYVKGGIQKNIRNGQLGTQCTLDNSQERIGSPID